MQFIVSRTYRDNWWNIYQCTDVPGFSFSYPLSMVLVTNFSFDSQDVGDIMPFTVDGRFFSWKMNDEYDLACEVVQVDSNKWQDILELPSPK